MIREVAQRIFDPSVECLDPSSRRDLQARGLRAAVARALETSAFYREKLGRCRGLGRLGVDGLAALPFTTRAELLADQVTAPPFGSAYAVPADRAAVAGRSGVGFSVTGRRLNLFATAADVRRQGALFARALWEAGVRPGERVYVADDPRYNLVAMYVMRAVCALGAIDVYVGTERSARTARYVVPVLPPAHVFLPPTYAGYLPSVLTERSGARWAIRSVSGWGEPGYSVSAMRARLAALWDAISLRAPVAIVDVYALSEAGIVAFGCREGHGLHVVEDAVVAEVVDPDGEDVLPAGERGEVVITLPGADALPLVRYRTGDGAVLDEAPCACRRTGRRLVGIERLAERVRVRGRWLSPLDVERALVTLGTRVTNFVLVRASSDDEVLRVRVSGGDAPGGLDDLGPALERVLGVAASVEVVSAERLPPFVHKTLRVVDADREPFLEEELAFQQELERD